MTERDESGSGIGAAARRRRGERGLTLVELLVVLLILGLIAAFAVPQVIRYVSGAKHDAAEIQVDRLSSILELYALDVGQYPTTEQGLGALLEAPAGADRWHGPYLAKADALTDPWGNPYRYRRPGTAGAYDVWSLGRDGREGGDGEDADITSW